MLSPWVWCSISDQQESVERLNLNVWVFIGANLDRTSFLNYPMSADDAALQLYRIEAACDVALQEQVCRLDFSEAALRDLLQTVKAALIAAEGQIRGEHGQDSLDADLIRSVKDSHARFLNLLSEELSRKNIYAVRDSDIYSVSSLIERGDAIIPTSLRSEVPQLCLDELRQAGRCLAFELPTASAFHVMRAIEGILLKYWDVVVRQPRPDNRNWGVLLQEIDKQGGNKTVIAAVKHFKDLHRNPIIHPEITLDMDEALVLWGAAPAVIVALAKDVAKRRTVAIAAP